MLSEAVSLSAFLGSDVMPYPGSGYVYSAMYYVPRRVAPFKGTSTANWFTAKVINLTDATTDWGVGIGALEEWIINFGWITLPAGLLLYGFVFSIVDDFSVKFPVLVVSGRLAAVWMFGYNLPTLLNLFGAIAGFGVICHLLFVTTNPRLSFRGLGVKGLFNRER